VPILPVPLAIVFLANQAVIKLADELFEAHPDLYNGTKYSVSYALYEIKESVVQIAFAAALWLLYRRVSREERTVSEKPALTAT
jgi:hypothetical protein